MKIIDVEIYNKIRDRKIKILKIENNNLLYCVKLSIFSGAMGAVIYFTKNNELGIFPLIFYAAYTVYKVVENNEKLVELTKDNKRLKRTYTTPIAEFQGKMANVPLLVGKNNNIYCNRKGKIINQHDFQSYIPRRISFI